MTETVIGQPIFVEMFNGDEINLMSVRRIYAYEGQPTTSFHPDHALVVIYHDGSNNHFKCDSYELALMEKKRLMQALKAAGIKVIQLD